jgi:hypothetical protein
MEIPSHTFELLASQPRVLRILSQHAGADGDALQVRDAGSPRVPAGLMSATPMLHCS